jgi:MarR family transcriptional regulator, organic hydroperoxide resistance regulator
MAGAGGAHGSQRAAPRGNGRARPAGGASPEREQRVTELGLAFRAVSRALNRLRGRDTHLGAGELSQAQFELLLALSDHDRMAAGELAAAARLTPATVTQMLDALAASGHVERVRSETDRRVVVSRLTPLGRRRIEAKRAAWAGRWQQALAGFDSGELEVAARVLGRLAEMLEEGPSDAPRESGPGPRKTGQKPVQSG